MASRKVGDVKNMFENKSGKIHYKVCLAFIIRVNNDQIFIKIFQISYDNGSGELCVTVVECQDLKKMDRFGKSDPFVRVYLLPGSHDIMTTTKKKSNLNPSYNETFRFKVCS